MSGMGGIYFRDGRPVHRADLEKMTAALKHRGLDGSAVWNRGSIGLCHSMLHTTPESCHERLPHTDARGDVVITADARIDNRDELLAALVSFGRPEDEVTDSDLILDAYEKWGEDCARHLIGAFAFALWDARKQCLFCARDHFGVKPFYGHLSDRAFIFGSEIKAILSLDEVPRRLDETRVADYLTGVMEDQEITFYRDIVRLPPGHSIRVTRDQAARRRYWALDPSRDVRLGSNEEYARRFRELFREAVRCRLRSARPVGSTLSGGLDSSSVACMARDLLSGSGKNLHTFSAVFDRVPACDERRYIHTVLRQGGFEPHELQADRLSPLMQLDRVLRHQDEAFLAPNLFMHWGLYDLACRHGVRVLLDGFDGDTTVSHGLEYPLELAVAGKWRTLAAELRTLAARGKSSPSRLFLRLVVLPLTPLPVRRAWRRLTGQPNAAWRIRNPALRPDFVRRSGVEERLRRLQGDPLRRPRTNREEHGQRLSWGACTLALEVVDRCAAAFAVEPRYPFFDVRLAEFCLGLPTDQKMSEGWTRVVLRRAMQDILPAEIQWRPDKSNLSANFERGLLMDDRGLVEEVVMKDDHPIATYLDMAALRGMYRKCGSHQASAACARLWRAVSLGLWITRSGLRA